MRPKYTSNRRVRNVSPAKSNVHRFNAQPYTVVLKAHQSYMDAINNHVTLDSSRRRELLLENIAQLERVHEYYGHCQEAEECAKEWARLGNKASEVVSTIYIRLITINSIGFFFSH